MGIKLTNEQKNAITTGIVSVAGIAAILGIGALAGKHDRKIREEHEAKRKEFDDYKNRRFEEEKLWDRIIKASLDNESLDTDLRACMKSYLTHWYDGLINDYDEKRFDSQMRNIDECLNLLTPSDTRSKDSIVAYATSIKYREDEKKARDAERSYQDFEKKLAEAAEKADVEKINALAKGVASAIREARREW